MSLRARLVLLASGLIALVLVALGAYLGASIDAWSAEVLDDELLRRAREIEARLEVEGDGELELEGGGRELQLGQFLVENARGGVLFGRRAGALSSLPAPPDGPRFESVRAPDGSEWRVLSMAIVPEHVERLPGDERPLVLRLAAEERLSTAISERFRRGLLVAVLLGAVLGAAGAFLLAGLFLAPLGRLGADIAAVEEKTLARRVSTRGLPPELASLARAFNDVLARLEGAFERQRGFVSRASHSLRTPLAAVLAQAEIALRAERAPEEYRATLEEIAAAARESSALVDGLLALGRADEAGAGRAREPTSLHAVVDEISRLSRRRAEEAGLALDVDVDADVDVLAARASLREALEALVDNALRYTPRGGRVAVRAKRSDDVVEIEVEDTGPGMSDDDRAHAFERFYRGRAAELSGQAGSGLGLALVRAVVDAHGAAVRLEERPGGGTRVVIRWPAA